MIKAIFTIMISSILFACTPQTNEEQAHAKVSLQNTLDSLREQHHIPGAVLLVKTPDFEGVLTTGETAFEGGKPITADTLFGIGSITKTIISALVLKLESEGKLSIHDSIGIYLPEYARWKDVTIEELLNMTSGIFNYMKDEAYTKDLNDHFKKDWGTDQLIAIAYQHPDDFKPGTDWNYTNTAYLLLGKIIEKVAEESVSDALNDQFFKPLNMHHAFFGVNGYSLDVSNQMALGYYNGVMMPPSSLTNLGPAAGGMVMSIKDLEIFLDHLFIRKDLLSEKQLNKMLIGAPQSLGKMRPTTARFGLGVGVIVDEKFGKIIGFGGLTPTYASTYFWIPDKQIMILVLATLDRHGDKDSDILFLDKPFIRNVLINLGV